MATSGKYTVPKCVLHFYDYCGGGLASIFSVFAQLYRSSFNLELTTFLQLIEQIDLIFMGEEKQKWLLQTTTFIFSSNAKMNKA